MILKLKVLVLQLINIINHLIERDLKVQTYNTGSMTERLGNMVAGFAQPVQVCQNIKNNRRSVENKMKFCLNHIYFSQNIDLEFNLVKIKWSAEKRYSFPPWNNWGDFGDIITWVGCCCVIYGRIQILWLLLCLLHYLQPRGIRRY